MKNTVRKGFLFLVIALIAVSGVFAQRVGDTVQVGGRNYSVAEVRNDGSLVLRPAAGGLDGVWRGDTSGTIITISGDTAVYTQIGNHALMQDAVSKGQIAIGDIAMQRLTRRTGSSQEWSGHVRFFNILQSAPNVSRASVLSQNTNLELSVDGRSLTMRNYPGGTSNAVDYTYTRQ